MRESTHPCAESLALSNSFVGMSSLRSGECDILAVCSKARAEWVAGLVLLRSPSLEGCQRPGASRLMEELREAERMRWKEKKRGEPGRWRAIKCVEGAGLWAQPLWGGSRRAGEIWLAVGLLRPTVPPAAVYCRCGWRSTHERGSWGPVYNRAAGWKIWTPPSHRHGHGPTMSCMRVCTPRVSGSPPSVRRFSFCKLTGPRSR